MKHSTGNERRNRWRNNRKSRKNHFSNSGKKGTTPKSARQEAGPLFEPLERRLLLSADAAPIALAPDVADGLVDGLNALESWLDEIESLGDMVETLPIVGTSLSDAFDISDFIRDNFIDPVQSAIAGLNPTSGDVVAAIRGVTGAHPGSEAIHDISTADQVRFSVDLTSSQTTALPIDLGELARDLGIDLDVDLNLEGYAHLSFQFGYDLTAGLSPSDAFFMDFSGGGLEIGGRVNAQSLAGASIDLGFIQAAIGADGEVDFKAALDLTIPDPDASDGRITLGELESIVPTADMLTLATSGNTFNITLPVSASLNGTAVGGSANVVITGPDATNLFDSPTVSVEITDADLKGFTNLTPGAVVGMLHNLAGSVQTLTGLADVPGGIPFIEDTVSSLLDMADWILDQFDPLYDVGLEGSTPVDTAATGTAAFSIDLPDTTSYAVSFDLPGSGTAQDLIDALNAAIGAAPFEAGLVNGQLQLLATDSAVLAFSLSGVSTAANQAFGIEEGQNSAPAFAFDTIQDLVAILDGALPAGFAAGYDSLTDSLTFTLSLSREIAESMDLGFRWTQDLGGLAELSVLGNAQADLTGSFDLNLAAGFDLSFLTGTTALSELNGGVGIRVTAAGTPDINIVLSDGTVLDIDLNGVTTLGGLMQAISDSHASLSADYDAVTGAVTLTDSSGGTGTFAVALAGGSPVALDLGFGLGTTDTDGDGIIEGGPLVDRFFIETATSGIALTAGIASDGGLDLYAAIGFIEAGVQGGSFNASLDASLTFTDGGDGDGRLSIYELLAAPEGDAGAFANVTPDVNLNPVSVELPIYFHGAEALGLSDSTDAPAMTLTITLTPNASDGFDFSIAGFESLETQFQNMSLTQVLQLILNIADTVATKLDLFNQDLPLIDASVNDVLSLVGDEFAAVFDGLGNIREMLAGLLGASESAGTLLGIVNDPAALAALESLGGAELKDKLLGAIKLFGHSIMTLPDSFDILTSGTPTELVAAMRAMGDALDAIAALLPGEGETPTTDEETLVALHAALLTNVNLIRSRIPTGDALVKMLFDALGFQMPEIGGSAGLVVVVDGLNDVVGLFQQISDALNAQTLPPAPAGLDATATAAYEAIQTAFDDAKASLGSAISQLQGAVSNLSVSPGVDDFLLASGKVTQAVDMARSAWQSLGDALGQLQAVPNGLSGIATELSDMRNSFAELQSELLVALEGQLEGIVAANLPGLLGISGVGDLLAQADTGLTAAKTALEGIDVSGLEAHVADELGAVIHALDLALAASGNAQATVGGTPGIGDAIGAFTQVRDAISRVEAAATGIADLLADSAAASIHSAIDGVRNDLLGIVQDALDGMVLPAVLNFVFDAAQTALDAADTALGTVKSGLENITVPTLAEPAATEVADALAAAIAAAGQAQTILAKASTDLDTAVSTLNPVALVRAFSGLGDLTGVLDTVAANIDAIRLALQDAGETAADTAFGDIGTMLENEIKAKSGEIISGIMGGFGGKLITFEFSGNSLQANVQYDLDILSAVGIPDNFNLNFNLAPDGGGDLFGITGDIAGSLTLGGDLALGFGVDFSSLTSPVFYLDTDSHLTFEAGFLAEGVITARFGGFEIGLGHEGTLAVISLTDAVDPDDDGTFEPGTGPASLSVTLNDLGAVDNRVTLEELIANPTGAISITPNAYLNVDLPVFFGDTRVIYDPTADADPNPPEDDVPVSLGATAHITSFDSFDAELKIDPAHLEAILAYATELNLSNILAAIETFIIMLEEGLGNDFVTSLPIVGESAADGATEIEKFRTDFYEPFRNFLENDLSGTAETFEAIIEDWLYAALGPTGLDVLRNAAADPDAAKAALVDITFGGSGDLTDGFLGPDDGITINLALGISDTVHYDFDLGLDAFVFEVETEGGVDLTYALDADVGFSLTAGGFAMILPGVNGSGGDDISGTISVAVDPDSKLRLELFFLAVEASPALRNPANLSDPLTNNLEDHWRLPADLELDGVQASFTVGLDIGDGTINFANFGSLSPTVHAAADIDIDLVLDTGFAFDTAGNLPSLETILDIDWHYELGDAMGMPEVHFWDLTLDLGGFLDQAVGPVIDALNPFIEPIRPLLDLLGTRIPGISDLSELLGQGEVTFSTLIQVLGEGYESVQTVLNVLNAVETVYGLIEGLNTDDLKLHFGDLDFTAGTTAGLDLSKAESRSGFDTLKTPGGLAGFSLGNTNVLSAGQMSGASGTGSLDTFNTMSSSAGASGDGLGIKFPIFDNPALLFGLLMGQRTDLIIWDIPRLEASFSLSQSFGPVLPPVPLYVNVAGRFGIFADFMIGYDTRGFESGNDIFDGFYFSDVDANGRDIIELGISAEISAAALLSVVIAEAEVRGGVRAEIGANWNDLDGDGKVYIDELALNASRGIECIFDLEGSFSAFIDASARLGFGTPFGFVTLFEGTLNIIDIVLFEFSLSCGPLPDPILGTVQSIPVDENDDGEPDYYKNELHLNIGTRAGDRQPGAGDGDETIELFAMYSEGGNLLVPTDDNGNGVLDESEWRRVTTDYTGTGTRVPNAVLLVGFGEVQVYENIDEIIGDAGNGDDEILVDPNLLIPTRLSGGAGNDRIQGGGGVDIINGGEGDDELSGAGGNDTIHGNGGNDKILGGAGADKLYGDAGNDFVFGDDGKNQSGKGDGNDIIYGGAGEDTLKGDDGNDTIYGDAGNDNIDGGLGNDYLHGGTEIDLIVGGAGSDSIWGDAGNDVLFGEGGDVGIGEGGNDSIWGGDGNDTIRDAFLDDYTGEIGHDEGADNFFGGAGDDALYSGTGNDRLFGGDGNDIIEAGDGNDYAEGNGGADTIRAGLGNDWVIGGSSWTGVLPTGKTAEDIDGPAAGNFDGTDYGDVIYGGGGDDLLIGDNGAFLSGSGAVLTSAGSSAARMTTYSNGGGGNDRIYGSAGNDTIFGGRGGDRLYGDDSGGTGQDIVVGDQGYYVFPHSPGTIASVHIAGAGGDDTITGMGGNDILLGGSGNDTISGALGDDVLIGDHADLNVELTAGGLVVVDAVSSDITQGGNDRLMGDGGRDILIGGYGADYLSGGGSGDVPAGGEGIGDILLGDNGQVDRNLVGGLLDPVAIRTTDSTAATGGNDMLVGSARHDVMFGGVGDDRLYGLAGNDIAFGDNGEILYSGGVPTLIRSTNTVGGSDRLYGAAGNDILLGGTGDDIADGDGGNDIMLGDHGSIAYTGGVLTRIETTQMSAMSGGEDILTGGTGNDTILGGEVGDTIDGNAGDDVLIGDNGSLDYANISGEAVLSGLQSDEDGTGGVDTVHGHGGGDILIGGEAGDFLYGDAPALPSEAGEDVIIGDGGHILFDTATRRTTLVETRSPGVGGDDTIEGNEGADIILGGFGNDTIDAGPDGASDIVLGDNGRLDWLDGGDTDSSTLDTITTTDPTLGGDDIIDTHGGADIIMGGTGSDVIHAGDGDDVVFGDHGVLYPQQSALSDINSRNFFAIDTGAADGGGDDWIYGEGGRDIMLGQQGSDVMFGGDGDDDLIGGHNVAGGADEADVMDGGSGSDAMAGDNAVIWRNGDSLSPRYRTLTGTMMYDPASLTPPVDGASQADPRGTAGREINILDHAADTAAGLYGGDLMVGNAGDDTMFGQLGSDRMYGDGSIDGMVAGAWEVNRAEAATDGDDYMEGNGGADIMFGGLGRDDMIGGSSSLFGLTDGAMRPDGSDLIYGGAASRYGHNDDSAATDLAGDAHGRDSDVILGDNGNIFRLTDGAGAFLGFNYDTYGEATALLPRAVELLDYVPGEGDSPDGIANGGADILFGESGDDVIHGMTGGDFIYGGSQDDDLYGEAGSDWMSGGTGNDGMLGDDGYIMTSRNGTAEPLYGIEASVEDNISTPGGGLAAVTNPNGELKKSVDLEPFDKGERDTMYGGLGDDWMHGGAGNDGMSGAEALPEFYDQPWLSGLVHVNGDERISGMGSVALPAGYYDGVNALAKVEGLPLNFDASLDDGADRLFGDLGHDWLVGGTGRDHLYGGFGNDILNADDNQDTNGGLNDVPDAPTETPAENADIAFGGGGRDLLIGNTGADRLLDWVGEFNSYVVPFAPFGDWTVERLLMPQLPEFLYALAESDGADQTRGPAGDPRHGEPNGELGLVTQKDPDWQAQIGAPIDTQAGNTPGGMKDTRGDGKGGKITFASTDGLTMTVYTGTDTTGDTTTSLSTTTDGFLGDTLSDDLWVSDSVLLFDTFTGEFTSGDANSDPLLSDYSVSGGTTSTDPAATGGGTVESSISLLVPLLNDKDYIYI